MTAFLALLRRDLLVARRNAGPLLVATLTQPILVVLVFGSRHRDKVMEAFKLLGGP